ncbi:hypothetical protein ACJJTC_015540 [Scirpophaga incertulas]
MHGRNIKRLYELLQKSVYKKKRGRTDLSGSAGVAGSDLRVSRSESLQRKWEKCAIAPRTRRSLLLSSVAQPTAAPLSARATRPAPAARSAAVAPSPNALLTRTARACDFARITVLISAITVHHSPGFSLSVRDESRNRVADKRCATSARKSRVASHSPGGSVSQAGKWRKCREAAASASTPTYNPGLPEHPGLPGLSS